MDKIWYRNPSKSEVIGRCVVDGKTEWPRITDKSRTQKNKNKNKQTYAPVDKFITVKPIVDVYRINIA